MRENFETFLKRVLDHEGRVYEDVAGDRGGPTKCGVTLARWADVTGVKVPKRGTPAYLALCQDLRNAPMDKIEEIYRGDYWAAVGGDDLPAGVDYCVADFGVNSGPSRALRYAQALTGQPETGKPSQALMQAIAAMPAPDFIDEFCDKRAAFLKGIVDRDPSQAKFRKGWLSRVEDVRTAAKKLAGKQVGSIRPEPMAKALPPEIGPKDLAGSRKMSLVQRMQAFWASMGIGGIGLSFADGMGYAKDFSGLLKDNAGLLLVIGSAAGIGAGILLARWMVEDAQEGRYRVGRD